MEINEIKSALDAHGAAVDAAIKKYEGQVQEQGKAQSEIRDEVKALAQKFEDAITEIASSTPEVTHSGTSTFSVSPRRCAAMARQYSSPNRSMSLRSGAVTFHEVVARIS